jgi:hypothetical protein
MERASVAARRKAAGSRCRGYECSFEMMPQAPREKRDTENATSPPQVKDSRPTPDPFDSSGSIARADRTSHGSPRSALHESKRG